MFIPNSISVGGSDFKRISNLTVKENFVLVYDNQPRNIELCKIMDKMIHNGYKVVVWPNNLQYKDINDMILGNLTIDEVMKIINENTYSKLSAKLKFNEWRKTNAI